MWTQCRAQPAGHDLGPAWCRLQQLLPEVLPWQDGAQQLSGTSYPRYASPTIALYQFHALDLPKICPFSIRRMARKRLLLHPQTLARRHSVWRPWQSRATL